LTGNLLYVNLSSKKLSSPNSSKSVFLGDLAEAVAAVKVVNYPAPNVSLDIETQVYYRIKPHSRIENIVLPPGF
jgi:hypothetical protein